MPELLRVIARLNMGGPARHVMRITGPLAERGWRTVLATGTTADDEPDLIDEAREAGLDVRIVPGLGRRVSPRDDLRAAAGLRRLLSERRPALVHTHTAKAGTLGRLACTALRPAPVRVHTFHGHVLSGYFGPVVSRAFAATEAFLARRTDRLVAVSQRIADELVQVHGVGRPEQYEIIPPGIDFDRTAPDPAAGRALRAQLGLPERAVLVGVVSRLEAVKNIDLALDAFAHLRGGGHDHVHLLVVGEGSQAAAVRARVEALPGAHWLPGQRQLGAVYGALDLALMTSHREGLPQVVAEALEAGVPVVSTAVGGVPELVRDGIDGLLVPEADGAGQAPGTAQAAALAAALAGLANDAEVRERFAWAARSRDRTHMGPAAVARRLGDLYDELCQPGRTARQRTLETGTGSGHAAPSCTSSS